MSIIKLFRSPIIESRRRKLYGDVSLWQPVSTFAYSIFAIVTVAISITFLALGKYSRKETVAGWVMPEAGLSQIYATHGGTLAQSLVKQGDYVEAGQPIARLSIDLAGDNGAIVPLQRAQTQARISELGIQEAATRQKYVQEAQRLSGQLNATQLKYLAEDARLVTQLRNVNSKYLEDDRRLAESITATNIEIARLQTNYETTKGNLEIEDRTLDRMQQAQGVGAIAPVEIDRQKQQVLSSRNQVNEMARQIDLRKSQINDISRQRASLHADNNTQIGDIQKQRATLGASQTGEMRNLADQRAQITPAIESETSQIRSAKSQLETSLADLSVQDGYVVRAPISGRITSLNYRVGEAVNNATPLASISPPKGGLVAELLLPTRAAGFVKNGEKVRIMIDAFPYQKFGVLHGEIIEITRSAFRPGEIISPVEFKEPVYRIRARLDSEQIKTYNTTEELQSGMTLKADIITDTRSFLEWILDPLMAARAKWES